MDIQYGLSAAELLKILGCTQPVGREWLEQLQREKQISLPPVYTEWMELAYQCPLFATSNLWTGKIQPRMYFDEIQEYIDDLKAHQGTVNSRNRCYPFMNTPRERWTDLLDDYLIIGSDYGGGKMFSCFDRDLNVIYAGSLEDGEIDLTAINRVEAEKVLFDIDDYEFSEEDG